MREIRTLQNGLRLVFDKIDGVRSTSYGIWCASGSVHETKAQSGISHFIEHMNFKGTSRRSALDIAYEFDAIGGQCNAFTAKEMMCFYGKTLDTHTLLGLDILCDMYTDSVYAQSDIDNEKKVILEEIAMTEDTPEELVVERLCEAVWRDHPLSNRIIGTPTTIDGFTTDILHSYAQDHIAADNTVVAISGNFNVDEIAEFLNKKLSKLQKHSIQSVERAANYTNSFVGIEKAIEQNHLCLSFRGLDNRLDTEYYALSILNTAFGNGMSSRLFQKLREQEGLVYSIYSFPVRHKAGGLFCIYAALCSQNQEKAVDLIFKELRRVLEDGLDEAEFERAKQQLMAGIVMGLEGTSSRMMHMGKSLLSHGKIKTPDEIVEKINGIDRAKVVEVARSVFDFNSLSAAVVGKDTSAIKTFIK